ncbi:MAG: cohesin domain-containing protein [Candidatus Poribacteria bacterium]|nr:cohesin domain-containing protein [Candidatus Poribacteria bacterium]
MKFHICLWLLLAFNIFISFRSANAVIIRVPQDHETIQAALGDAFLGDVINIDEGTFEEGTLRITSGITLLGKSRSKTIIKGSIEVANRAKATLKNLTISNPTSTSAIYCNGTSPLINKVTIIKSQGDGIQCDFASPHILDVVVANCRHGILVNQSGSEPRIESTTISNCSRNGVYSSSGTKPTIQNTVISSCGSHGVYCSGANATVETSTITKCKQSGIFSKDRSTTVRRSLITQNEGEGVTGIADIGTNDDPGNNQIFRNRRLLASGEIIAVGNWWGTAAPTADLFSGKVTYKPFLKTPPSESGAQVDTAACLKGDVNGDELVKSIDASLALRIAARLIKEPTEAQTCGADMNEDGLVKSIDASLILRRAAGLDTVVGALPLIWPNRQITDRNLKLGSVEAKAGEIIIVPITLDQTDQVISADLSLSYDSEVLQFLKAELGAETNQFSLQVNDQKAGQLIVPISARDPLGVGSGTLLNLTFTIKETATVGITSQLTWNEALLWDVNAKQLAVEAHKGSIIVKMESSTGPGGLSQTTLTELPTKTAEIGRVGAPAGQAVTVPIIVPNAAGLLSADLTLTYNADLLAYQGLQQTPLIKDFDLEVNSETAGRMVVPISGKQPIDSGGGELLKLTFFISSQAQQGASLPIELTEALLWNIEGRQFPTTVKAGQVTVGEAVTISTQASWKMQMVSGLNMISLPLQPDIPLTASSLAKKLAATLVLRLDTSQQDFEAYVPEVFESFDFSITGGEGYIVNTPQAQAITFKGTAWDNANAAPGLVGSNWAFVLTGQIYSADSVPIQIRNLRTGQPIPIKIQDGHYLAAVTDLNQQSVVRQGDRIEIQLGSTEINQPLDRIHHRISDQDVERAFAKVDLQHSLFLPRQSRLLQNYPNPFNPETWIPFELNQDSEVTLTIYDQMGKPIRQLNLGFVLAGKYTGVDQSTYWDGRSDKGETVASGTYFYHLQTDNFSSTQRMIILK